MSTQGITPRLANSLRSLAECQLLMQTARSAALDGGALGVMAVDAAVGAIAVDTRGAYDLWIAALVLLGLSLSLAVRTLRIPGAERTGPVIEDIYQARETQGDNELEDSLHKDLAQDIRTNTQTLARKDQLFDRALTLLVLALLVELAGRVVQ